MAEYIDRQTAIAEVHRAIYDFFDIDEEDTESPITYQDERLLELNKDISARVKNLPAANRWIPCSERLPESDTIVLISVRYRRYNGSIGVVVVDGSYSELAGEWYSENMGGLNDDDVLAWQPLPEPYEGGKDEHTN